MPTRTKSVSKSHKVIHMIGGIVILMYAPRKKIAKWKVNRDLKRIREELKKLIDQHKFFYK